MNLGFLDLDALKKGDVISANIVESVVEMSRRNRDFSLELVKLKDIIECHFERSTGKQVSIATHNDEIHILTDSQATAYTERMFSLGQRKMRRHHRKALAIESKNLTHEENLRHVNNLAVQGIKLQALRRVRNNYKPAPVKRTAPGMNGNVSS